MKLLRKSLLLKLVGTFSTLSVVTVGLVAFTAYGRAKDALQDSVFERLNVAASLKEYEFDRWLSSQKQETIWLAQSPELITRVNAITADLAAANTSEEAQFLRNYFNEFLAIKPDVQEISILSIGGYVLLSTDETQEGKYQGLGNNTTYFELGQEDSVVPTIYNSSQTNDPRITLATPIKDDAGQRVLALTLNLQAIERLIHNNSAEPEENGEEINLAIKEETYLVIRDVSGRYQFIASDNADSNKCKQVIDIDAVFQGRDGKELYSKCQHESGKEVPVIGVFRLLQKSNSALLTDISQEEAFQPAIRLAHHIIWIGLGTAGLMLVMIYVLARQIARPILALTDVATAIETGNYDTTHAPTIEIVKRRFDELGQLASVFQSMADQIYAREQKLKQQVAELKIEIDQAKKSRQVAEITETEYFQDLRRKAQELRKPKGNP